VPLHLCGDAIDLAGLDVFVLVGNGYGKKCYLGDLESTLAGAESLGVVSLIELSDYIYKNTGFSAM
jgi:hypothetical protein